MNIEENNNVQIEKVEKVDIIDKSKNKTDFIQIIQLIKLMLSTNENFDNLIAKANLNIPSNQSSQIKNILNFLISNKTDKNKPINNIIQEILNILSDNKVELYEIPSLINVIHESFKNIDSIKIDTQDIGILIKLILFILVESKIVHLSSKDNKLIFNVIDTSMALLNKSVEIKYPKFNKCLCF